MKKKSMVESVFPEHRGRYFDEDFSENSSGVFNEETRFADKSDAPVTDADGTVIEQTARAQSDEKKNSHMMNIGAWGAAKR
jgi:hypothetical protein